MIRKIISILLHKVLKHLLSFFFRKRSINLPFFGDINTNPTDFYETTIELNSKKIEIDLNFYKNVIKDTSSLNGLKNILNNLEAYNTRAMNLIKNDFNNQGLVFEYIEHHLTELNTKEINELLDTNDEEKNKKEIMLSKFSLNRVGFYPEDSTNYAIFDYSIGSKFTDYLIVIRINEKGEIVSLGDES